MAAGCGQRVDRADGTGRADALAEALSSTISGRTRAPTMVLAEYVPSPSVAVAVPAASVVAAQRVSGFAVADAAACLAGGELAPSTGCPEAGWCAPPPARVPPPLVLVPGTAVVSPPVSTTELAWTIACRTGGTASAADAMKATPARTAAGRTQLLRAAWISVCDIERGTGLLTLAQCRTCCRIWRKDGPGHAQWPRQTQFLARSTTPLAMASGHGRGGRRLVLARIRSRPSAPGSTPPTAAESALRRACSRSSSGPVMPSPACRLRHAVSCSKIDRSAVIPRAVWLFTAPRLIPIVSAISASDRSA